MKSLSPYGRTLGGGNRWGGLGDPHDRKAESAPILVDGRLAAGLRILRPCRALAPKSDLNRSVWTVVGDGESGDWGPRFQSSGGGKF